jgi:FXSXX-COOH protein
MERALDEVVTNVVDLSGLSLDELRCSDDPVLVQSLRLLSDRTKCSRTGLLQNQFREDN